MTEDPNNNNNNNNTVEASSPNNNSGGVILDATVTAAAVGRKLRTVEYAPAVAPWTRPVAIREDELCATTTIPSIGAEDHRHHGAFRISGGNHEESAATLTTLADHMDGEGASSSEANVILVENDDDDEGGWNEERGTRDMLLQLKNLRSKRNLTSV
eukprot:scaffold11248_cov60-Cylindrotheca_fusiformis.AAC.1